MLEILALVLFAVAINWSVKFIAKRFLHKSMNASSSVRIRRTYRYVRIFIIILYTMIIIPELYVVIGNFFSSLHTIVAFRMTFGAFILAILPYASMSLPISVMTIKEVTNSDFSLFLRGFSHDSYEESMYEQIEYYEGRIKGINKRKKNVMELPFSERDFARAVKHYFPIYSVGMTKELESPEGTKRIYLDDETWQKDVAYLINKAKYIFILVNPSNSCVWEILHCQDNAINKTIFFIDNNEALRKLQEKMGDNIPKCLKWISGKHFYAYILGEKEFCYNYINSKEGFLSALSCYFEDKEAQSRNSIETKKSIPSQNCIIEESVYNAQRHGCVTTWLWMVIISNLIYSIYYIVLMFSASDYPLITSLGLTSITAILNVLGSILLMKWNKYGFYIFVVSSLLYILTDFAILHINSFTFVSSSFAIIILWSVLQIRKEGVSVWSLLKDGWNYNSNRNLYQIFGTIIGIIIILTIIAYINYHEEIIIQTP